MNNLTTIRQRTISHSILKHFHCHHDRAYNHEITLQSYSINNQYHSRNGMHPGCPLLGVLVTRYSFVVLFRLLDLLIRITDVIPFILLHHNFSLNGV